MTSTLNVLIVDDSRDLGNMLVEYLHEVGLRAVAVATAEEGIDLLELQSFDVLMTDVRLPGMSGIALVTRAAVRWPQMGIVISSGYGDALELEYFPKELASVVRLVPKPCDLPQLPAVLADAAAHSRPSRS
jgi:two-component system, NtrC family, response regulator AtoC